MENVPPNKTSCNKKFQCGVNKNDKPAKPPSSCRVVSDPRDLKLKDAEKQIKNKDVIINMLQDHVRRLEESYKQNMRETENFRYKFCLASEQVKRLRASKKNETSSEKRDDCRKESDVTSTERCCYLQQIQKVEEFMKAHYELLQNVVGKMTEKRTTIQSSPTEDNLVTAETLKLQHEIDRLKEENAKLRDQLGTDNDPLLPKIRDSLLETYRKTNEELQKKVSTMVDIGSSKKNEDDYEDEDEVMQRRISFNRKTSWNDDGNVSKKSSKANSLKIITEEIPKQKVIDYKTPSIQDTSSYYNEVDDAKTKPDASTSENSQKERHISIQIHKSQERSVEERYIQLENKTTDPTSVKDEACQCGAKNVQQQTDIKDQPEQENITVPCSCTGVPCSTDDIQKCVEEKNVKPEKPTEITESKSNGDNNSLKDLSDMVGKLNDIREKVSELITKQSDTHKEVELLKGEMTISRDTTRECTDNISKLKQTIEEQKETFLNNFQEHRMITDNLTQVNDKIQQELAELKSKIETLFDNVESLKHSKNVSDDVITTEECQNEISIAQMNMKVSKKSSTVDSIRARTEHEFEHLETNQQKPTPNDKPLAKLEEEYNDLKKEDQNKNEKIKCINALISYYEKISKSVVALQTQENQGKLEKCTFDDNEINQYLEQVRSENLKLKITISSVINHLNEKMKELKDVKDQEQGTTSSLCACLEAKNKGDADSPATEPTDQTQTPQEELQIEDIYKAVRRSCDPSSAVYNESSTSCVATTRKGISCYCGVQQEPQSNETTSVACHCSDTQYQQPNKNIEEIYTSVLCMCRSGALKATTPQAANKKNNSLQEKKCSSQICSILQQCVSDNPFDNSDQCLASNLETYVNYLYEQLNIISSIENKIEDLRCHIKEPQ